MIASVLRARARKLEQIGQAFAADYLRDVALDYETISPSISVELHIARKEGGVR